MQDLDGGAEGMSVREAIGLAVAPIGALFAVVAYFWLVYGGVDISPLGLLVWVAMFAYPTELIVALPGHLLLRRRGVRTRLAYVALGGATGVTPFIALAMAQRWPLHPWAWVGVWAGLASALVFRSVAVARRESHE
jgi:hypothetical protein